MSQPVVPLVSFALPVDAEAHSPGMLGSRPQGKCNCDRAATENVVTGAACDCGQRPAGMRSHSALSILFGAANGSILDACTCEKAADGGLLPGEVDFTTKAT